MKTSILLRLGAALAAAGPLPGAAHAQQALPTETGAETGADASDEILVTARRREERAQDVPIALSVVGQQQLEATGFVTLTQIQQLVPSMQVFSFNPRNTNINIRGLGSNVAITNDGLEYGVGVYVDNVYYGRPAQSQFELVDLDRVEVLRGPQGTLFGKNTTAGALNITSRLPSFTPEATAEVSVGDYGYHQVRGSASAPLVADKVALRLSVADTHRDGFLYNTRTGKHHQEQDNFTVRGQLLVKPSPDLSIRLIGDYSKQNYSCCTGVVAGTFTTFSNGAPLSDTIADQAARAGYVLPPVDPFARRTDVDSPIRVFMESYGASGQVDWDFGKVALTSITAYRWWDWDPRNDNDGTGLPIWVVGHTESHQQQFSQEVRLASTGRQTVDWVLGAYYFWQRLQSTGYNAYGDAAGAWFRAPSAPLPLASYERALNGWASNNYLYAKTNSYAAFGQASWNITERLSLTGGLRFTHEEKWGSFRQLTVGGQDISGVAGAQAIRNGFLPEVDLPYVAHGNDSLTGLASLGYKIAPTVLAYGSYARGGKSGGLNLSSAPVGVVIPRVIAPEKVDAFELGLKSELWDRRLTFNLAAFWTDVSDYQSSISTLIGSQTVQYIQNVGSVRSRGVEIDARVAPTRHVAFTGALSYVDASYRSYPNAPAPVERQGGGSVDLSGQAVAGSPEWTYSIGADIAQPLAFTLSESELYAHADYSHRSSYFTQVTNSAYSRVPAYGIANLRLGWRTANGLWDLSVWARNLFDEAYFVTLSGSSTGRISGIVGEPRTIGLTFRTKF
ncbi:MAG: TonB-dependent receptor [Sphingobium sp.]